MVPIVRVLVNQRSGTYMLDAHVQTLFQSGRGTYFLESPSTSICRPLSESSSIKERHLQARVAIHINIVPMILTRSTIFAFAAGLATASPATTEKRTTETFILETRDWQENA
ncbi:hypothetical protein HZ326_24991 [Fusarium oxysporum f. sp. albedinis]|nr:hypothetical protein HZ326_24991 [Fusarium oxysporum f. sp. albedinis]